MDRVLQLRPAENILVRTHRLDISPLTYRELDRYLQANNILEKERGLAQTGRVVSADVKEMVETFTLPSIRQLGDTNYLFYTFWLVVDRSLNTIVSELGFKGVPNRKGEIEIGYGTMPGFEGMGYMTEAVGGMIEWCRQRDDVRTLLAETRRDNHASIRIVEKNGFERFERRAEMIWWKLNVSN